MTRTRLRPGGQFVTLFPVRHPERPAREKARSGNLGGHPKVPFSPGGSPPLGRCGFAALAEQPNVHRNGTGRPRDPTSMACERWGGGHRSGPPDVFFNNALSP